MGKRPEHVPTLCGIKAELFAKKPSPEELAAVLASMDSNEQAEFFGQLAHHLWLACGMDHAKAQKQLAFIADDILAQERADANSDARELVADFAAFLKLSKKHTPAAGG